MSKKYVAKFVNGDDEIYVKDIEAQESIPDIQYDVTNKKLIQTINGLSTDIVTSATIVADGGINVMTGATSSTSGMSGLVPAPAAGDQNKYLQANGTWNAVTTNDNRFITQTGTCSLYTYSVSGSTYYIYYVPQSVTECEKVYSIMFFISNPVSGTTAAYRKYIPNYYDQWSNLGHSISNAWVWSSSTTNIGTATYRIIKAS